jgi:hypothetical protein
MSQIIIDPNMLIIGNQPTGYNTLNFGKLSVIVKAWMGLIFKKSVKGITFFRGRLR